MPASLHMAALLFLHHNMLNETGNTDLLKSVRSLRGCTVGHEVSGTRLVSRTQNPKGTISQPILTQAEENLEILEDWL